MNDYFLNNAALIDWRDVEHEQQSAPVEPWKPEPLSHEQWPPDYKAVYAWRIKQLAILRSDKDILASAMVYYKTRPGEFIMHWMDTYNPRKKTAKWMPFVFFNKQMDYIHFLDDLVKNDESGLVEKCRDAGVTWLSIAYTAHSFIFNSDSAIGWGSRKQDLVDKLGNPDSIFEKLRLLLSRMPDIFLPSYDATFMRVVNHDNKSVVMGEAGDNIGRGGRTGCYFIDEAAHVERPEKIEAALGDNTNVQIDISSVNGLGNVFHRRREAGIEWQQGKKIDSGYTRIFIFDWRDHPEKTQEWYDTRRAKYEREGMLHIFAQEVDRNYSAAVHNTIIPYEWIVATVDAHKKIKWKDDKGFIRTGFTDEEIPNVWTAGLDVADGGIDRNALIKRQWIILRSAEEWGERDPGVTTRRTIAGCRNHKNISVQYDCIGVGAGVKSEFNRLVEDKIIVASDINLVPWNAGAGVVDPFNNIVIDDDESPMNKDVYRNMKAQAWVSLRSRCYKTFKNVTCGDLYPVDDLISLDSRINLLHQLMKEMAQPVSKPDTNLRTVVDKQPDGTKSPNLGDGTVMAYFPIEDDNYAITGTYGA